ncbi:MAG: DNA-3-methyladenine glycosylase 2 family protein [Micromonosporaceae bacterium]|nr:DNA-3-methyladenine glycosylase 2 family protein [Micromonosporaceae bacterium]
MELDFERCYRAVDSRDQRFDGWFYTGVTTTRIYCRPSCPAITPKRENIQFYPSAAAAQRAGFRACKRCRPDASPGSPHWDARADVVARAMRLIADGVVDREGVPGLARRLGYTQRHLHRMLTAELGAGPLALARAQRAQTARILIETTDLGLAEIAFAAGFGSVRQFNDTLREVYAVAPSEMRAAARRTSVPEAGTVHLRLPYRAPLHAPALLEFFAARAVPGLEECGRVAQDGGVADAETYRRALRLPFGDAIVALTPRPGYVAAALRLADLRDLAPAVARCRRLFDLDADPVAVDAALAADEALAPTVAKEPGVRLPRAVDGFEMAVRAIVGQQISVAAARKVLAALLPADTPAPSDIPAGSDAPAGSDTPMRSETPAPVVSAEEDSGGISSTDRAAASLTAGTRLRPFPSPEQVLELPDAAFAMPAARRETIRALARAVAAGKLELDPGADRAETERRLTELPGIGPWTASYIALRGLGDPDVFLATDLGVRRGAGLLGLPTDARSLAEYARRWGPWRSYATIRLWRQL